jgi:glutamine cyclotransferase
MKIRHPFLLASATALTLVVVSPAQQTAPTVANADYLALESGPRVPDPLVVQVLAEYPHDPRAYTQGLLLDGDVLLESTGQYGRSELREVDLATGVVMRSKPLPTNHFGEGLVQHDGRLIQLTWKEGVAHLWDRQSFETLGQIPYTGEGWGLTSDGTHLIMSNGSNRLFFRDPQTFAIVRELAVTVEGEPVSFLNELEYAENMIWANVWQQDFIVGIDPASGEVRMVVDARALRQSLVRPPGAPPPEVLNGIAYNATQGTFYLTGKYWPTVFEVQFVAPK